MKYEKQVTKDKIMNCSLIDDEVIIIKTSMCKDKGAIQQSDKKSLSKFFGYSSEMEFKEIYHINQLMPQFVGDIHDTFLDNYLSTGRSSVFTSGRQIFYEKKQQFI